MGSPKILEFIDGIRQSQNMTRAEMAEKMEKKSGESWDKAKLDKSLTSDSCPRASTLFLMLDVLGQACFPWKWCESKKMGDDE